MTFISDLETREWRTAARAGGKPRSRAAGAAVAQLARLVLLLAAALLAVLAMGFPAGPASAQADAGAVPAPWTDGPRETLGSFLALRDALDAEMAAYLAGPSRTGVARANLLLANLRSLIHLEPVAATSRRQAGDQAVLALIDIFARMELPDLEDVPEESFYGDGAHPDYRVAGTPIRIVQIAEGRRAGEWLFAERTIETAPRFLAALGPTEPLSTSAMEGWSRTVPQLTGPLVPQRFIAALPDAAKASVFGLPVWKSAVLLFVAALAVPVALLAQRRARALRETRPREAAMLQVATPLAVFGLFVFVLPFVFRQLLPFGQPPYGVTYLTTLASHVSGAWLFWRAAKAVVAFRAAPSADAAGELDHDIADLLAVVTGILGAIAILVMGMQQLGLPVVSLIAGLGVGGLAVALAVRPTLENLIGGMILYIDKPVQAGDFCTFGDKSGTVEHIGIRSTSLRARDRTLITIPNAHFADLQLVNWAECDMMLIGQTIGLRLETQPDQLRFVLAEIRQMLHSHPRVDNDTVRIRYAGPSASAREIDLRFYALTREWNDFYAIREDVFFRVDRIVAEAGTNYATAVHTLRVSADDGGIVPERRDSVEAQVAAWREAGKFPFPNFSKADLEAVRGTVAYPPEGSPEALRASGAARVAEESLSTGTRRPARDAPPESGPKPGDEG